MNNTQHLHHCYRKLRRLFPVLPKRITITFATDRKLGCLAEVGVTWKGATKRESATIVINERLRFARRLLERELLHEVAHIITPKRFHRGHGKAFRRSIRRIYKHPDAEAVL